MASTKGEISLSELKAKRAEMTPGRWWVETIGPNCNGMVHAVPNPGAALEAYEIGESDKLGLEDEDLTGILATHNAADVLIEIAEAALRYWTSSYEDREDSHRGLAAALAKVKP